MNSRICPYCHKPVPENAQRCPKCEGNVGSQVGFEVDLKPTLKEIPIGLSSQDSQKPSSERQDGSTVPYRPILRPPRAALCILDDGGQGGEWVRIRSERIVIGRTDGDVVIPDDSGMSTSHVELVRRFEGGYHRWYLKDLNSRNGTFVNAASARLRQNMELMIGMRRFRFETGASAPAMAAQQPAVTRQVTQAWQVLPAPALKALLPALVELTSEGGEFRHSLSNEEHIVGADASKASVHLKDDPTVSPTHARLIRDSGGRWSIEDMKSLNGTWLRTAEFAVDSTCSFQLGEQRFVLKVL